MCKQHFKIRAGHVSHKNVSSLSTLFVMETIILSQIISSLLLCVQMLK